MIRDNVNEAEHILLTYYETNKPDSLFSCFLYSRDLAGSGEYNSRSQPPSLIMPPWDSMRRRDVQKLRRKTVVHPLIGPQATEAVRSQIKRYLSVYRSIKQHDYQPNVFGHIQGYVLDRGDDAVFVATSGKHRIAVLAALGWERIPVTFKPNMPPCFCLCQSHYWPNVVNGLYSVEEAEMIFNGYFAS